MQTLRKGNRLSRGRKAVIDTNYEARSVNKLQNIFMLKVVDVLKTTEYPIFDQSTPCGSRKGKSKAWRSRSAVVKLDRKEKSQFYSRKTSAVEGSFHCSYLFSFWGILFCFKNAQSVQADRLLAIVTANRLSVITYALQICKLLAVSIK
jgi:hypothetical protein